MWWLSEKSGKCGGEEKKAEKQAEKTRRNKPNKREKKQGEIG